jgi:hypothetical protein
MRMAARRTKQRTLYIVDRKLRQGAAGAMEDDGLCSWTM